MFDCRISEINLYFSFHVSNCLISFETDKKKKRKEKTSIQHGLLLCFKKYPFIYGSSNFAVFRLIFCFWSIFLSYFYTFHVVVVMYFKWFIIALSIFRIAVRLSMNFDIRACMQFVRFEGQDRKRKTNDFKVGLSIP